MPAAWSPRAVSAASTSGKVAIVDANNCKDCTAWGEWIQQYEVPFDRLFHEVPGQVLTLEAWRAGVSQLGFRGSAAKIFSEIRRLAAGPASAEDARPLAFKSQDPTISLQDYKAFESHLYRMTSLATEEGAPNSLPVGMLFSILRPGRRGPLLGAWRKYFDPRGIGRVRLEEFTLGCKTAGFPQLAALAWRDLSSDGRILAFSSFSPRESANLTSFGAALCEKVGCDLKPAWEVLDINHQNRLGFEDFERGVRKLGFTGDVKLLFDGTKLDRSSARLFKDDFLYLRSFLWYKQQPASGGADGTLVDFVCNAYRDQGGPDTFIEEMGKVEGERITVEELVAHLNAIGFPGDALQIAKSLADQERGSRSGTEVRISSLISLLCGEGGRGGQLRAARGAGRRCQPLTAAAPPQAGVGVAAWDSSINDISLKNKRLHKEGRQYFGMYSREGGSPSLNGSSSLSSLDRQPRSGRNASPGGRGFEDDGGYSENGGACWPPPTAIAGGGAAPLNGGGAGFLSAAAMFARGPRGRGGAVPQDDGRRSFFQALDEDSGAFPPHSPTSRRPSRSESVDRSTTIQSPTMQRLGTMQRSESLDPSMQRFGTMQRLGTMQRPSAMQPSGTMQRMGTMQRPSSVPPRSQAMMRSTVSETSLLSPSQGPRPPTFRMFSFEATKLRGGSSGYKAVIDSLTFFRNGNPVRGGEVVKNPYSITFDTPVEVDEFRLLPGNTDPSLDILQWSLTGSNDGNVWRNVHSQVQDYNTMTGRLLQQPIFGDRDMDVLRVVVVEARGLVNNEISKHQGLSDPYATVWVDTKPETKAHTEVFQDSRSPKWNARLEVHGYETGCDLRVLVRNSNFGHSMKSTVKDAVLGQARIPSSSFDPAGFDGWVNLQPEGKSGSIKLRVRALNSQFMSQEHRLAKKKDPEEQWLGDTIVV